MSLARRARLPGWAGEDPELPRVISAGPWLSTPGLFSRLGREVAEAELPDAAAEEAAAGDGWVKLRGDWIVDEKTIAKPRLLPAGALAAAVRRVHEAGGRVAVHAMGEVAWRRAVEAKVDSLEHGLWLAHDLLPRMAAQGTALVPTYTPWAGQMEEIRALRPPARRWFLDGYARLGPLTAAAHAAGVAVLAGTDFRPHGTIAAEVRHLAAVGLPPEAAIARRAGPRASSSACPDSATARQRTLWSTTATRPGSGIQGGTAWAAGAGRWIAAHLPR